jgi:hypothetical protein
LFLLIALCLTLCSFIFCSLTLPNPKKPKTGSGTKTKKLFIDNSFQENVLKAAENYLKKGNTNPEQNGTERNEETWVKGDSTTLSDEDRKTFCHRLDYIQETSHALSQYCNLYRECLSSKTVCITHVDFKAVFPYSGNPLDSMMSGQFLEEVENRRLQIESATSKLISSQPGKVVKKQKKTFTDGKSILRSAVTPNDEQLDLLDTFFNPKLHLPPTSPVKGETTL